MKIKDLVREFFPSWPYAVYGAAFDSRIYDLKHRLNIQFKILYSCKPKLGSWVYLKLTLDDDLNFYVEILPNDYIKHCIYNMVI
jgi:hypothetical protein